MACSTCCEPYPKILCQCWMGYAVCNTATCLKAFERPGSASRQNLYGSKQSKSVWQQIWLVCQASSRCRKTAAADTTGPVLETGKASSDAKKSDFRSRYSTVRSSMITANSFLISASFLWGETCSWCAVQNRHYNSLHAGHASGRKTG